MYSSLIARIFLFISFLFAFSLIPFIEEPQKLNNRSMILFSVDVYRDRIEINSFHDSTRSASVHWFSLESERGGYWIDREFTLKRGDDFHVLRFDSVQIGSLEDSVVKFGLDSDFFSKVEIYDHREYEEEDGTQIKISDDVVVVENKCPANNHLLKKFNKFTLKNSCFVIDGRFDGKGEGSVLSGKTFVADSRSSVSFLNMVEKVEIKGMRFTGGGTRWSNSLFLSGSINLYNVNDFHIDDLSVAGSYAEDALHIKESTGIVHNSRFVNCNSDAVDIDLSRVRLRSMRVDDCGGDGLDLSKSNVELVGAKFSNIFDKAISVGENSFAKIEGIDFLEGVSISVASKDSSLVKYKGKQEGIFLNYQKKIFWNKGKIDYE